MACLGVNPHLNIPLLMGTSKVHIIWVGYTLGLISSWNDGLRGFYVTSPYTWHGDVRQGAVLLTGAVWLLITLLSIWSGIVLVAGVFVMPYLIFLTGSLPMIHTSGLPSPLSFHFPSAPLAGIVKHSASSVWLHIQMLLINLSSPQSRFFGKPSHLKWRFVGKVVTKSSSPYDMNTFSRCEYQCPSTTKSAQI
jgi:hypothetical protein